MSLSLVALVVWLGLMPLGFGAAALLLPARLHRRATTRLNAGLAQVVDLQVARDRRSGVVPRSTSRAL